MKERLMKQVERAVRPVRASCARKMQMREELLAHLTALFDEERERHGNDDEAFVAAARRFGDPAALAKELDASVGPWQRVGYAEDRFSHWMLDRFEFRPDASLTVNLVRTGRNLITTVALFFAVAIGLSLALVPERRADPIFLPFVFKLAALMTVVGWLLLWATQTILPATRGLSLGAALWTVVSRGLLWSLGLIAASSAFWWAVAGSERLDVYRIMVPVELVVMPALLFCTWAANACQYESCQALRKWSELQLDE